MGPNPAHEGLARLQQRGWCDLILTQNVDRLHHKAGSSSVLELHGTTHRCAAGGVGDSGSGVGLAAAHTAGVVAPAIEGNFQRGASSVQGFVHNTRVICC